jgi:molybdenum cofactor biosynthesis enzyme MoaA
MRGFNDDEICDFVQLTEDRNLYIRLIEYMLFTGNKWNDEKIVSYQEMVESLKAHWPESHTLPNGPNNTSRVGISNLQVKTGSAASPWLCIYEGHSEMIWRGAAVSGNKKL